MVREPAAGPGKGRDFQEVRFMVDVIVIAIVAVLFILCIRKQVIDHKKGIPSCGLNCGGCSGGSCSCSSESCSCDPADIPEQLKLKKK